MSARKPIAITQASWLKPGWLLALNRDKLEATRVNVPRGDIHNFANAIMDRLDVLQLSDTTSGIFMTEEDCALITEHFPQLFYKS